MARKTDLGTEIAPLYVFPSALGWVALQWQAGRLIALVFGWDSGAEAAGALQHVAQTPTAGWHDLRQRPTAAGFEVRRIVERIQAYAEGQRDDFLDIPVAQGDATSFQRRVLNRCRRIPYGQTLTYGELAAKSGFPRAGRAVGRAMAGNRVPLIIPCHRVVGAYGSLGGYSGAGGIATKQRLLELEGARWRFSG